MRDVNVRFELAAGEHRELKVLALRRGVTLRQLLIGLVRKELAAAAPPPARK